MDLSIIIVSWNVREKLKANLEAIHKSEGNFSSEIFVVDNNSADGAAGMVKKYFPDVKLIANEKNLGFARASNQGIKKSKGRYVLLLNPDMRPRPDTLARMLDWMDKNKQADVAGCRLVNEAGGTVPQVRRFPALWDQLAVILKLPHLFPFLLRKYLRKNFDYDKEAEVDSIRGSFFLIRRETIEKIGLLDERFFLWFEEVDYCRRLREVGGKIFYTPVAQCLDHVGRSFSQLPRGRAQRYFRASMLAYFRKWQPAWQYLILKLAWPLGIFLAKAGDKITNYK